ncbi:SGNH hydrolase [Xylariaceae sp. FL0594]|nr:SGNH hydrolase [Xylariaceae sp. FL0594]
MLANDWGSATPDIRDSRFGGEIQNAINAARKDSKGKWTFDIGGYNANDDAGSPGTPNCNGVPTNPNPDPGNPGGEQPAPGKRKFMIAGDSISHGAEDDWTWRYRLWQWLRSSGYDVEFVGPFRGTHITPSPSESIPKPPRFEWEPEPQESKSTAGRYADGVDGDFKLSGHAAWWGRQAVQSKDTIKGWVKDHQPDYLLLLLGFNDLGWWVSGPDDLVGNMGQLVQAAREAKPDIRILVGNVVHRSFIGGRQDLVDNTDRYNAELKTRLKGWFRYESPIVYVDVNANYDCHPHDGCADGYDGLHPNARGEYHIAQAFARALRSQFGFSKGGEFSVPIIPGRPVGTPTNVRSYAWPEGDGTTWDRMYNARGYDIRSRIQGAEGWWSDGAVYPNTWTSWAPWVTDGQVWEYQVRTQGDGDTRSAWSGSSVVTSRPKTAPGPDNIVVMPYGNDAIQFSWTPVTGYSVNRYSVIVWNQDIAGSFVQNYAASGASTIIPGLVPGHLYSVWIATCNNLNSGLNGQAMVACGLPQAANDVRVGGTAPSPPSNLRVTNIDPTTVKLEWSAGANAVGYFIYVELVSGDKPRNRDGSTTSTTHSIGFLFPGTWNYRFCVSSYNGSLETAASCVVPPKYPGFKKRGVEVPEEVEVPKGFTLADNVEEAYNATTMVEDPTLKMLNRLWTQQKEAAFF